jgi:hypothetical protein
MAKRRTDNAVRSDDDGRKTSGLALLRTRDELPEMDVPLEQLAEVTVHRGSIGDDVFFRFTWQGDFALLVAVSWELADNNPVFTFPKRWHMVLVGKNSEKRVDYWRRRESV